MKSDSTEKPPTDLAAVPGQWDGGDEFPEGAAEFTDEVSRRRFLTLAAASAALAGAAGCVRPAPARKIVAYSTQPDEITPGVPLYFATAAPLCGYGTGILVRSNEGRPTKIEGNPDHPSSLGGAGVYSLGSLLDLYDPDRSKGVTHRGQTASYDAAVAALRSALYDTKVTPPQPKRGIRLRILTETVTSPTLAATIAKLLTDYPDARWVQYEAAGRDGVREAARKAFGRPLSTTYDFVKADVVLSLDADFLTSGPGAERYSRDFADRRKIRHDGKNDAEVQAGRQAGKPFKEGVQTDQLNRLYAVESMPTPTGAVADHRLALPSSLVESFARALAVELGIPGVPAGGALPDAAKAWLKPLAADLNAKKGKSIVVAGDHQPASLHALVHAINNHLGNLNKTVLLTGPVEFRPDGKVIDLKQLAGEMAAKQVDVLLVFGVNAAYTAPADVPFTTGVKNVPFSLHLGTHQDETAVLCEWHLNEAHYLEAWGDIRGHDGTVAIQQPLIAPIYNGRSVLEVLGTVTGAASREGLDIVRAFWKDRFAAEKKPGDFEVFWQEAVRLGFIAGTALAREEKVGIEANWAAGAPPAPPIHGSRDFEINFRLDPSIHDGRYANNGWLQELPKPITKMTWDNAAYMSKNTAEALELPAKFFRWTAGEHGRVEVAVVELKITVDGHEQKVMAPAWVLPGHADNSITVHLGYGRERACHVNATPDEPNAEGKPYRGFNANRLRGWVEVQGATGFAAAVVAGLTPTKTEKEYYLACTQGYELMTQTDPLNGHVWDRKPVRFGTVEHYKKEPGFAKVPPMAPGEWKEINENVPGPKHGDEKPDQKHELSMYYDDEKFERFTPGLRKDQQRRWAMAIDLNACTGCSACMVACVSENNIPVVGKYEVTRGRAMHWINIDRYYSAYPEEQGGAAITLFQPRMCVQCENAPCEIVCPVGATVHSADGLNDMTYNRCVGTRYCSNNCPYKVRRFNFLTFADWHTSTLKLGRNPDVSVRSRGVMEKCTFCVQRIRGAEIVAEREHRSIKDHEIVTACQAACPSGAIVFGDINDAHSTVSQWKNEPRNYGLLAELNTRPRLTHLGIVRNPNPAMPKGA
jgi:Fe-S-cluster-containing dehydrogenase component/anaerobic selenocysteine-containing dehydrogenase